jgi:uncharacterized repeat protein (TIGR01451 family)
MQKKYLSAVVAVCLSGVALALLGFFLASGLDTSYASPARDPVDVPDLVISVYAGDETILANEVISYMIHYTNTLGTPLDDVVITSTLSPKQFYTITQGYLSDPLISTDYFTCLLEAGECNFDNGYTLEWQLGTLPAGAQGWIAVTTTVPPEAEPPWEDNKRWPLLGMSAVITTSTPGVSVGNPQGQSGDDASVMVVGPVLRMTKVDDPDPARPGRLLTYTLTLQNKDREDVIPATAIVITDVVPANTMFYDSLTGVYSPTADGDVVIWNMPGPLERGATVEVSFTVRITPSFSSCPPPKIKNLSYYVDAAETISLVSGEKQETTVDDVLEKTIETPTPPPGANEVFPGRVVTYTINVYNPLHDQALTGLRITDTLPGVPNPFTFLDMVSGDPITPTPVMTSPQVVWDGLSVPAGGEIHFSFSAWVPYHIDIGSGSKTYKNSMSGFAPGVTICPMNDTKPSEAKVTRQIKLQKSVEPSLVLSGEVVTYTITIENVGDTEIRDIRLTDTLPFIAGEADFYYLSMVYGPQPEAGYRHNPVVWDDLYVPPYSQRSLVFRAIAIGWTLREYANTLSASSPWTTIPGFNGAKVKIDSPFRLGKSVEPSDIFLNESTTYDIVICNVATGTQTIDGIGDRLAEGFEVEPPYDEIYHHRNYPMANPIVLGPDECGNYSFWAIATWDLGCGNLPKTYWNEAGHVGFHVEGYGDLAWYVNVGKLAPLQVLPDVMLEKEPSNIALMWGESLTYTIRLYNNREFGISNVSVEDILPGDGTTYLEYVGMVSGPEPVSTATHTIEWEDLAVNALNTLELVFRVRVPQNITWAKYKNYVYAGDTTETYCVQQIDPTAEIETVKEIIELKKKATPTEVPPLGIVRYEITLKNKDSVPVTGINVTDTLPSVLGGDFVFVGMAPGDPAPSEVNGRQVVWRNLTVPGETTLKLRFDAQASPLYGLALNEVDAWCPRSQEITPEDPWDVVAPVSVLPGVLVEKTADVTQAIENSLVVYTITLYNGSKNNLTGALITDTLPAGFLYHSVVPPTPIPISRSPLVWRLDIPKQSTRYIVFKARVMSCDICSGTYHNTVTGYSPDALIPGVKDAAPVEVAATGVPCAALHKTVSPTETLNGGIVTYEITLYNNSNANFVNVRITDTLPADFSYLQMVSGPNPIQESPLVWTLSQLQQGQNQKFIFQARAGFGVSSGVYSNTVTAESDTVELPTIEEIAPVKVKASVPMGAYLHEVVSPTQAVTGGAAVYTITLDNWLDTALASTRITNTLPADFLFLRMKDGPNPVQTSPLVWNLGQVDVGERQQLVFEAHVGCNLATGTYTSTVEGYSPSAMIQGATVPIVVESGAPCVELYKAVSSNQVENGETVVYTITLENQSGLALNSVHITDTLPTGFTYTRMLYFGVEPTVNPPQLVWDLTGKQIEDGEDYNLIFEALVGTDVLPGTYLNQVAGRSSPDLIPATGGMAPVEVQDDTQCVFLPLVLRSYGQ